MQLDALSMVYARSLFELADEAGGQAKVQEIADELEQIVELARADKGFRELLTSPIIDTSKRRESLSRIFANQITDTLLRFLLVLNNKGRLRHLESIAGAFDHLVHESFGRVEVDLYTAAPLGATQLADVTARIQKAIGREPVVHPYTDSTMIGGMKLRIGDQLIDGSVSTRLRRMKSSLLSSNTALRDRIDRFIG